MTKLLAQHGSAKGKKIEIAMESDYLQGAIFAPREEKYSSIKDYIERTGFLDKDTTFLDPQLYYSTFEGSKFKNLENYPNYPTGITRRDWRKQTPELLNFLDSHGTSTKSISNNLITPGFYIQSLDWKFDYSLDIYEYCRKKYEFNKYYLSLLIATSFFHSKSDVDEMLEDLSENVDNKDGIYFILCHDENQEKNYEYMDSENIANIIYFIYSLRQMGFNIINGYTFMNGILSAMLDCEYVATGWFNTLRIFRKERFEEIDTMGIRKKRYTSIPLLSYITFDNINNIGGAIDVDSLLSGCDIDEDVKYDQDAISFVDLEQQYWQALHIFISEVNDFEELSDKINYVQGAIKESKKLYSEILENLVQNKEIYNRIKIESKHLDSWILGIEMFKKRIALI